LSNDDLKHKVEKILTHLYFLFSWFCIFHFSGSQVNKLLEEEDGKEAKASDEPTLFILLQ